jgi:hypothetical protein
MMLMFTSLYHQNKCKDTLWSNAVILNFYVLNICYCQQRKRNNNANDSYVLNI